MQDVLIAGGGLIGLACALELRSRGLSVTVLERGRVCGEASTAAAGMLAGHDATHPEALRVFAEWSESLYAGFLQQVCDLSGTAVPLHTRWALERAPQHAGLASTRVSAQKVLPSLSPDAAGFVLTGEDSLDPRLLAPAVRAAAAVAGVLIREGVEVANVQADSSSVRVSSGMDRQYEADLFLDCTGAWCPQHVFPVKGQMLRVRAPHAMISPYLGPIVVRSEEVYAVPRVDGTVVIGATVEQAGFDRSVHDEDIARLRALAAGLVPELRQAPEVERWAGLRPGTPDGLPVLGRTGERTFVAAGHFRNGILLAPGTARLIGQLLTGAQSSIATSAFRPERFSEQPQKGESSCRANSRSAVQKTGSNAEPEAELNGVRWPRLV